MAIEREQNPEEIAEIFTVSVRTVYTWIKDGCPKSQKKKQYFLNDGEVQNWIESTSRQLTPGRPKQNGVTAADSEPGQDKEYWLTRKYKRECLVAEKNLIPRDDVISWIRDNYTLLKGRLLALPATIVSAIAGHDEPKQERLIAEEINVALDDLKAACEKFQNE